LHLAARSNGSSLSQRERVRVRERLPFISFAVEVSLGL
jgi:hypothetical protein